MAELAKPYELLELQDGQSTSFSVLKWEKGATTVYPAHMPGGKVVDVLRVHVPQADKPHFPFYLDLTAASLVAQVEPHLKRPDLPRLRFRITAHGIPPKKRFTLEVNQLAFTPA